MALTISNQVTSVFGNKRISKFDVAFDSSYPTGGESLSLSNLGLSEVDIVLISQKSGYVLEYDYTNKKVLAYRSAGFTPAGTVAAPTINIAGGEAGTVPIGIASDANAAALSKTAATARTGITGVQAPAFTGTAVAAAALVEVADTTNLSTLTGVRFMAIGV